MSSPRLEPWLMPETISSGRSPTSPSSAKRTQSTGVPSVAKPVDPSANGISSTQSGERVVMLRAVALRLESGAITWTSRSGILRSSVRRAFSPVAWIPSSLVIRTLIPPPILRSREPPLCAGRGRLALWWARPPGTQPLAQVGPGEAASCDYEGAQDVASYAVSPRSDQCDLAAAVGDDQLGHHAQRHSGGEHQQAELSVPEPPHRVPNLADHVEDRAGRDRVEEQLEGLRADVVAHDRAEEDRPTAHQAGEREPTPAGPHIAERADDAEALRGVVDCES